MRSIGNERCGAEKNRIGTAQRCNEKHWQRTDAHRDAKEKNGLELNCQEHKSKGNAMKRPASEKKSKDWLRTVRIGKEWRIIEMLRKGLALNRQEQKGDGDCLKGGDQNDN